jgi:hypothetical protein
MQPKYQVGQRLMFVRQNSQGEPREVEIRSIHPYSEMIYAYRLVGEHHLSGFAYESELTPCPQS